MGFIAQKETQQRVCLYMTWLTHFKSSKCTQFALVTAWLGMQLMINLTSGDLRRILFCKSFGPWKFSFSRYHESNLSLTTREIIPLMVNHQLIPFPIRTKSTSLEQSCFDRSKSIVVTSLYCLFFRYQKTKTKNGPRKVLPT